MSAIRASATSSSPAAPTRGNLYLGYASGGAGVYSLSGTGQLSTTNEFIGYNSAAAAVFQQSGGTNTATSLTIGPSGRYRLSGGTLQIANGGMISQGIFDGGGRLRPAHRHGLDYRPLARNAG